MIGAGPKDNANPTVHSIIDKGQRTSKPVGWSQVERVFGPIACDTNSNDSLETSGCLQTLEDRAVMHALAESMEDGVYILKSAGISLEELPRNKNSTFYHFTPHSLINQMEEESAIDEMGKDEIDVEEIFTLVRCIQDPEHPLTLEQLRVVSREQIEINHVDSRTGDSTALPTVEVRFTPTIPHCSMATLIGLCIRVKLFRSLPRRYKVTVKIEPHTHQSEIAINKQLADKERVSAALENKHLLGIVNRCILNGITGNLQ